MKRPEEKDFDYGDYITDWLAYKNKYIIALNEYIDYLEEIKHKKDIEKNYGESFGMGY